MGTCWSECGEGEQGPRQYDCEEIRRKRTIKSAFRGNYRRINLPSGQAE
jgi:hypothetical protein